MKILEQRLLKATEDFLESRDVDVSMLKRRALNIINTGILNMGRLNNYGEANAGNNSQVNINNDSGGSDGK